MRENLSQEALELNHRENAGVIVSLLWRKASDIISVAVHDEATNEEFELSVPPEAALDAFYHPFAYAARIGTLVTAEAFESIDPIAA
jgi:hypothetical protein